MKLRPVVSLVCLAMLSAPALSAVAEEPTPTPTASATPTATVSAPAPNESMAPRPEVSVSAHTAGDTWVGVGANVWGTATNAPDALVWTEALLPDGTWSRSQSSRTDANGGYVLPLTYGMNSNGVTEFRVAVITVDGTTYSDVVSLTRRSSVSISSTASAPVGREANAWGTVTGAPGVKVWSEAWVGGRWVRSQVTTTNSRGGYIVPLTYGINSIGTHTFRVGAATPTGVVYSGSTSIKRTGYVTASSADSAPVNREASTWGTVHGASNARVWTEVYVGGRWLRSSTGTTNSAGGYMLPLSYGSNTGGKYTFRVGASTASGIIYSSSFSFTRVAPYQGFTPDSRCMYGRVFCASKDQRKMAWMVDGRIIEVIDVRFGRPGYETRNGNWTIFRRSRDHISSLYNVPMPFAQFFSGGQAIHFSSGFARVGYNGGSAGCINIRSWAEAQRMWDRGRIGDRVVVFN